jgi:hypothetical protein
LQFEKAALLRDQIRELKGQFGEEGGKVGKYPRKLRKTAQKRENKSV